MIDKNTNYYKIGFSKNPKYREKTLQSEKPTIELIKKYVGYMYQEKELHDIFSDNRIRGEWFELRDDQLKIIDGYFNLKINFAHLN